MCVSVYFTQHVAPSATLQWIGEEVSKPAEDSDHPMKAAGSWPLYRSPCPHTRILSVLIIFSTITQGINENTCIYTYTPQKLKEHFESTSDLNVQ